MKCTFCDYKNTLVISTKQIEKDNTTKRIRKCLKCGKNFNTIELAEVNYKKLNLQKERFKRGMKTLENIIEND